jgi:hypothetical protein
VLPLGGCCCASCLHSCQYCCWMRRPVKRYQEHTKRLLQGNKAQLALLGDSNVVAVSLLDDLELFACSTKHISSRWQPACAVAQACSWPAVAMPFSAHLLEACLAAFVHGSWKHLRLCASELGLAPSLVSYLHHGCVMESTPCTAHRQGCAWWAARKLSRRVE